MRRAAGLAAGAFVLAACAVGPDYQRPALPVPETYRGEPAGVPPEPRSFGDLGWWEVFEDPELQALIRQASERNYDLRVAVARVLEARARLGIQRSFQFPELNAGGQGGAVGVSREGIPPLGSSADRDGEIVSLGLDLRFEVDLWGRLRRATESARAQLLASDEARATVLTTVVTDMARAYFALRELDAELEIARRTVVSREGSLKLARTRRAGGVASGVDVAQAEGLVESARSTVADLEGRVDQQENLINFLLGQGPGPVPRGRSLTQQALAPTVPPGLPATLLERRPDLRQSEQQLVAANADIGAAKALLFPQIVLTGAGGVQSSDLSTLFSGPAGFWSLLGGLAQPIFNAGRLRENVRATEARQQQALVTYERTVQQAFREVADALVGYRKAREVRERQEALVRSSRDYARLALVRYRGGITSYLEVLDADRQLFDAELSLARVQRDELIAVVGLYKALGGGWQPQRVSSRPREATSGRP